MSRSGYRDDGDGNGSLAMWRGAVMSAINGKRGQDALRELAIALDAMPEKELAAESLVTADGEFCTLGVLGMARGIDLKPIDSDDWDAVAKVFALAPAMVREIVHENDEAVDSHRWIDIEVCGPMRKNVWPFERHHRSVSVSVADVAARRWHHMRKWVSEHLKGDLGSIKQMPTTGNKGGRDE